MTIAYSYKYAEGTAITILSKDWILAQLFIEYLLHVDVKLGFRTTFLSPSLHITIKTCFALCTLNSRLRNVQVDCDFRMSEAFGAQNDCFVLFGSIYRRNH